MPGEIKNPLAGIVFETKGVPTLYCNHVTPSLSFTDVRIYLSEVMPKQLMAQVLDKPVSVEPQIEPHMCIVLTPEFAKNFSEVLIKTLQKYEEVFGPLRQPITQEHLIEKLSSDSAPKI